MHDAEWYQTFKPSYIHRYATTYLQPIIMIACAVSMFAFIFHTVVRNILRAIIDGIRASKGGG